MFHNFTIKQCGVCLHLRLLVTSKCWFIKTLCTSKRLPEYRCSNMRQELLHSKTVFSTNAKTIQDTLCKNKHSSDNKAIPIQFYVSRIRRVNFSQKSKKRLHFWHCRQFQSGEAATGQRVLTMVCSLMSGRGRGREP